MAAPESKKEPLMQMETEGNAAGEGVGLKRTGSTSFQPTTKVDGVTFGYTLKCVWTVFHFFWCSDDRWTFAKAWVMGGIILASTFCSISVLVGMGEFQLLLGNNLVNRNSEVYYYAVTSTMLLFVADTCYPIIEKAGGGAFMIEWRRSVFRVLSSDYISPSPGQAFFQMKSQKNSIDNPDQRLCQDVMEFCEKITYLASGSMWCLTTEVVFTMQLLKIPVVGFELAWKMIVFLGGFAVVVLAILGPPIMRISRKILAEEANLRFALIRVREHAEPVAFYRGYTYELSRVFDVFRSALWLRYQGLAMEASQALVSTASATFPHVLVHFVVGPKIVTGEFNFGYMGQTIFLFDIMLIALSGWLHNVGLFSIMAAQAVRVTQLIDMIDHLNSGRDCDGREASQRRIIQLEDLETYEEVVLSVKDVTFQPPGFPRPTCSNLNLTLYKGDSCLLAGPSGIGKSSILRCIAGLWVDGKGNISRCPIEHCFMLPQEAYLCLGTLRSNIIYPELETANGRFTDTSIEVALEEANLGKLLRDFHLDEEIELKGILSGGEKQRLSFARLILRESMKMCILDEATAALDIVNEEKMYTKMKAKSDCYLSVGHRPTLDRFHTHRLLLEKSADDNIGALGTYEKLDPNDLPSARLAREMAERGEA